MDEKFKSCLAGAFLAAITHHVERGLRYYWPGYPAELKQSPVEGLPDYGALLSTVPTVTVSAVAVKKAVKPRSRDVALGAVMYSAPRTVHVFTVSAASKLGVGFSHRAPSPYVTKAERLPFQTDIGY